MIAVVVDEEDDGDEQAVGEGEKVPASVCVYIQYQCVFEVKVNRNGV